MEHVADKAIEVCYKLLCESGDDGWIERDPEKAGALIHVVDILEGVLKDGLGKHAEKTDSCYVPFVTVEGEKACFVPARKWWDSKVLCLDDDNDED